MDYSGYDYAAYTAASGQAGITGDPATDAAAPPSRSTPAAAAYFAAASLAAAGAYKPQTQEEFDLYKEAQKKAWQLYFETAKAQIKNPFAPQSEGSDQNGNNNGSLNGGAVVPKKKVIFDPLKLKKESTISANGANATESNTSAIIGSLTDEINGNQSAVISVEKESHEPVDDNANIVQQSVDTEISNQSASDPNQSVCDPNLTPSDSVASAPHAIVQTDPTPISIQEHQQNQQNDGQTVSATAPKLKLVLKPSTESRLKAPQALTADQEAIALYDARIEAEQRALEAYVKEQMQAIARCERNIVNRQETCAMRVKVLQEQREAERVRREEEAEKRQKELERLVDIEKAEKAARDAAEIAAAVVAATSKVEAEAFVASSEYNGRSSGVTADSGNNSIISAELQSVALKSRVFSDDEEVESQTAERPRRKT
ncbi:hypothetical protein HDU82_008892, partial [Entophlyctis luteolus]